MIQLSNGDLLEQKQRDILIHFNGKRTVLCTSPLSGGITRNLTAVFNHCDKAPSTGRCDMLADTYEKHLAKIAQENGLQPERTAGLSTACRMDVMKIATETVNGITITACVTGGITKNGRCAGDLATLWEEDGIFSILKETEAATPPSGASAPSQESETLVLPSGASVPSQEQETIIPPPGTINIFLHINANLTDSALTGCLMLLTETKVSKIHEMHLKSCYSEKIATGSGTDGVIIIADAESERKITQIRTDTKLGETIAHVAGRALEEMLEHSLREEVSE